ncbi:MAG: UDP-4-amino-4,6-dideoxy-N-acetyl-beta-L-altrosamine transaminase [Deltaproteobacteria bacterium]|nr:UDP-4-amino-4,6-dideoxy-N-acetyl-beta-L-altrosamine transaminase [Deltaproteobacteria bacterium]
MTDSEKPYIPYSRQWIDEEDIGEVAAVLRSEWLTTGPQVKEFEEAVARFVGARHAVAVSNGTAALHAAVYALGIGPGDEVIAPPMTFVATANAVVFQGGLPVFADVEPDTLLLDPARVEAKIGPRTRAIIAVDYAGQPCDYEALRAIAGRHGLDLVADACHALGAQYQGTKAGALADLTTFSFHPAKHLATGEGGMVTTDNPEFAEKMRRFRNHGISTDLRQRLEKGTWHYEMVDLGYNYRLTDMQCALGLSQLRKLPAWLARRQAIARRYGELLQNLPQVSLLAVRANRVHAYHLYVILLNLEDLKAGRDEIFLAMREERIGVNVHYQPVHLHPYYRRRFQTGPGDCPVAEKAFQRILTLPMFPAMSDHDVDRVATSLAKVIRRCSRGGG